jgi:hypothetical protein
MGAAPAVGGGGAGAGGAGGGTGNAGGVPDVECDPTGAAPQLLADATHPGGGIALTPTHVYWLEPKMNATTAAMGEARRAARCGGAEEALTLNQPAPHDAVAVGSTVYWTNTGTQQAGDLVDGSVRRVGAGGAIDVLVPDANGPRHIAADADHVYWAEWGAVRALPLAGGPAFDISNVNAHGIAVDADAVYIVTDAGALLRAAKEQGAQTIELAPAACTENLPAEGAVAVDDVDLYWIDVCGAVRRVPKSGGDIALLAEGQTAPAPFGGHRIAVDDAHVYWVTADSLVRVEKAGGTPATAIAPSGALDVGYVGSIVVGEHDVFWSAYMGIWRFTKP